MSARFRVHGFAPVLLALAVGWGCPTPSPLPPVPPTPPVALASLRVEVFEGDPASDHKVPGVQVRLDGIGGETTDGAGNVEWRDIPPGPRHLFISASGYQDADQHLDLSPGLNHIVQVTLTRVHRVVKGRLQARGRALRYPDGAIFRWRGVTAFALVAQVAHGNEAGARAYLGWARDAGFTLVRVLAMCEWLDLSPEAGLAALPRTLELIRAYDLYAEVVALADTATWPALDLGAHVATVGRIAAITDAAVLQLANEPWHPSQRADRLTPDHLALYRHLVAPEILVAYGASTDDESAEYAGGDYTTVHLDRSRESWDQVRRVRELENLSTATGKPVVSGEPIGFGDTYEPGRRWTDPSLAFAFGVLSRVFEVGTTFHLEAGLRCSVPGPVQRAAAEAFLAGTRILPDEVVLKFANTRFGSHGWDQSPVESFDTAAAVRVYSGLGSQSLAVALGLTGDPRIEWRLGYRPLRVLAERPGITVWEIGQ